MKREINAPLDYYFWVAMLTLVVCGLVIAPQEVGKFASNPIAFIQSFAKPVTQAIAPKGGNGETEVSDAVKNPNVRAFLDMLAFAEGTSGKDGYRMLFGGGKFSDFSRHPDKCIAFFNKQKGRRDCSTAAGRYQILDKTAANLGMKDFTPASQDKAAVALIRQAGALADVEAGRLEEAVGKVRRTWASLPGAGYRQPEKNMEELRRVFDERLKYHKGNAAG